MDGFILERSAARAEYFMRPGKRVHFIVMGTGREVFQHAQELVVLQPSDQLHVAGLGLRAHRLGVRFLVAGDRSKRTSKPS